MPVRLVVVLVSVGLCLSSAPLVMAQKRSPAATTSALCTRDNALDTAMQQMLGTRTFDNSIQRIAVLLRAADLLWPHQREKALAAFMEAFDLAGQNFKETGDESRRVSQSQFAARIRAPDQRYKVISALAKRDPAAARKLSGQMLEDEAREAESPEILNEIADAVTKAPKTIVSARALLALAHLYAKIDVNRGIEELGNAVRTINSLESPDFSLFVMMKIEGKTFGSYASFSTPGFNPENAFREMGKLDFDGSLTQATTFTDKSLRALTTLAVIEPCLQQAPIAKPQKAKP